MAQQYGLKIKGIILNQHEAGVLNDVEIKQGQLIEEFSGVPILGTCPYLEDVSSEGIKESLPNIKQAFKNKIF